MTTNQAAGQTSEDMDLDFTGIKFINPGEYGGLSPDAHKCIALAQSEMLAVSVMVYQVSPDFTGAIKGNIATVGRETVIQEVDPRLTPKPDIPHLMIHEKSALNAEVKPGDEVVIRYADGSAKVTLVDKDAKYAYEIKLENDDVTQKHIAELKNIAKFLREASGKGKLQLSDEQIAEVIGNAITNAHFVPANSSAVAISPEAKPDCISIDITQCKVNILNLQDVSIETSTALLKAHNQGYRLDLQESTVRNPQIVFVGTPVEAEEKLLGRRMRM